MEVVLEVVELEDVEELELVGVVELSDVLDDVFVTRIVGEVVVVVLVVLPDAGIMVLRASPSAADASTAERADEAKALM